MEVPSPQGHQLSRRAILRTGTSTVLGAAATAMLPGPIQGAMWRSPAAELAASARSQDAATLFHQLDVKIEGVMAEAQIPGVAVAVYYQGQEYVRGYGVTNVDYPQPVDGDTLFRIGSITKTFTGTTVMRLVEQGLLDLNAPVRTYLPDSRVADERASEQVTLRQCLDHSAGWLGNDIEDFGRGDDASARYVASMARLPQHTPPGTQFEYSNSAISLMGRVVAVVTGQPYEDAVRALLIDPLGLDHTRYFTDQLAGYPLAGSHDVVDGQAVFAPALWHYPRSINPAGGLISSARDLLRYARFHLGDGRAPDGTPVLTPASLAAMRSNPGPGGTQLAEMDGYGVSLCLRRTAEGVRVVEHGGDWAGQHAIFLIVPERDFALTLLTNSSGGLPLKLDLCYADWALERFAGLHNPPADPIRLPAARLAEYEGTYLDHSVDLAGGLVAATLTVRASDGALQAQLGLAGEVLDLGFEFYRGEYVLVLGDAFGAPGSVRANFVRGVDGRVAWLSLGGKLFVRQG